MKMEVKIMQNNVEYTNEQQSFWFILKIAVVVNSITLCVVGSIGLSNGSFIAALGGWLALCFLPSFGALLAIGLDSFHNK